MQREHGSRGECFLLPFDRDDICALRDGFVKLNQGLMTFAYDISPREGEAGRGVGHRFSDPNVRCHGSVMRSDRAFFAALSTTVLRFAHSSRIGPPSALPSSPGYNDDATFMTRNRR